MNIINDRFLYQKNSFPSGADYYLDRPHLNGLFENAIQKPLTTVVAGAGYGKTQAASALYGLAGKTVIWIQLSALDNHLARLWERFLYGFQSHSPKLASN